jgi:hypothetical protein
VRRYGCFNKRKGGSYVFAVVSIGDDKNVRRGKHNMVVVIAGEHAKNTKIGSFKKCKKFF